MIRARGQIRAIRADEKRPDTALWWKLSVMVLPDVVRSCRLLEEINHRSDVGLVCEHLTIWSRRRRMLVLKNRPLFHKGN